MWLRVFFILAIGFSAHASELDALPITCRQCLVVITPSWDASAGEFYLVERDPGGAWTLSGPAIPVRVGKRGLAWGRGLVGHDDLSGPSKREGDNKAPAGVFRLGRAFGYAAKAPPTRLPYLPLSKEIVAVDDPKSRYYNQVIDQTKVRSRDWRTAENMILSDDRYKWGVIVLHNMPPLADAGSCIFLHVWKNPDTATTGCTAMPEAAMLTLLRRIDPARHPLLIQLPAPLYQQLRSKWNLPAHPNS